MFIIRLNENEDSKLRQQYRGIYTIDSLLSPTNVILTDENGRQLSRSVYINNLKHGLDNAQSEEDNNLSEYEDEIPQHSENDVKKRL